MHVYVNVFELRYETPRMLGLTERITAGLRPKVKRGSKMGKSGSHGLSFNFKKLVDAFGMEWREVRKLTLMRITPTRD